MDAENVGVGEIKEWLKIALRNEHLKEFSLEVLGQSEKGDGYLGDIIFAHLSGETESQKLKEYDLVLKCGKKSQTLRDSMPIKETFENEIYFYDKVFPEFKQFQADKGLKNFFDSVPRCFGTYVGPKMEILVLENLKMLGYKLYNRKQPLTIDHLNLIMTEYGRLHAISAAMQDQCPENFKNLTSGIRDIWGRFAKVVDLHKFYSKAIDDSYDLVKEDVSEHIAERLQNFKDQILHIFTELIYDRRFFSVITHGDNWNNNFMFKYEEDDENKPVRVAMIDWQISKFSSPVTDLSYFLYSCTSKQGLEKFDDILKIYHDSFSSHLKKLGSDPRKIFPYSQLVSDWKVLGRFGVLIALFLVKIASSDKDEVVDIAETFENGQNLEDTFSYEIKDKKVLKSRILCIVEHAVEREFI